MNPYDQAHALARALKESEEYREYMRLKETAYDDGTNKALLDEYKRLQFRMQAKLAAGENMPEEDLQRLQQIGALLQFNPDVSAFLMAEFRFQRMLSDIFKILADVAGVDLDMLAHSPTWPAWIWTCWRNSNPKAFPLRGRWHEVPDEMSPTGGGFL